MAEVVGRHHSFYSATKPKRPLTSRDKIQYYTGVFVGKKTSVQGNLAKGRIAVLSPLAAANAFIRRVRWAGTFASGGRRTVRNALTRAYITVDGTRPSKVPLPVQEYGSQLNVWFIRLHESPSS